MDEIPKNKSGWRIVRRILIGVAIVATLVAIFYTEENWRGRWAWKNCKLELEAKGYVLDWNKYIPPPVPDDQNFFKAPKMAEWFVGKMGPSGPSELTKRLQSSYLGLTASAGAVTNLIATAEDARNYLDWSDQFRADFNLIHEALKRPYARMDGDYSIPYSIPIPNFVAMRLLAQTLAQRAHCYLLLNQPGQALQELTLMHDSCKLLEGAPTGKPMTLVAAMINVAVHGLYVSEINEGFRLHVWQEPQLVELQKQCGQINFPPMLAQAFDTEPAATTHTLETMSPGKLYQWFSVTGTSNGRANLWKKMTNLKWALIPRGWIYQNMVTDARLVFTQTGGFNPAGGVIQPKKFGDLNREMDSVATPYKLFAAIAIPNFTRAWQTTAHNQVLIDEAQIACALERYHLAHGEYPDTLDTLVPQFIEKLPQDIIGATGQPLHYRHTDDGKFLLYSVGWNEKDDGGKDSPQGQNGGIDYSQGDWVWKN